VQHKQTVLAASPSPALMDRCKRKLHTCDATVCLHSL